MNISRRTGALVAAVALALAVTTSWAAAAGGNNDQSSSRAGVTLDAQLARAMAATAKYAENLSVAKHDGYGIITRMIPGMGYHFMNPAIKGFDVRKPPILVYEHQGSSWRLSAVEWVFTSKPARPPLPGARYGAFGAGCHYADGTFVPAAAKAGCPATPPGTRAAFGFWHPRLVTLHVWLWRANPDRLFASTNPTLGYQNPLATAYGAIDRS